MIDAEPISPLIATANYSYDSRRFAGDGYILVGDAAAFIDPLFSSGVMMAMSSAALARLRRFDPPFCDFRKASD